MADETQIDPQPEAKPDPFAALLDHQKKTNAAVKAAKQITARALNPRGVTFTIQRAMAESLKVDPSLPTNWIARGMPGGREGPWDLGDWFTWYRSGKESDDEIESAGPPSPALERWREARAKMVEMDLAIRRGELLERDRWLEIMNRVTATLRQAGEVLMRLHGPQAHAVVDDALAGMERDIAEFFGERASERD